jgi:DNA-directed RNA polymerase beta' subunit
MTSRFDEQPISDRLAGVSFGFYTDEEVKKLSVQKIVDPVAFDHLNNPTKQGLHDKKLGVSPFDHKSACPTCGMTVNYCPGHVGHIELAAPIYNPFLFKDTYKLLKAKCFGCHRLRIHGSKQEAYIGAMKLLKAGDVIHSQELKSYLLYAAKNISLFPDSGLGDVKKMAIFKANIERQAKFHMKDFKLNVDMIDMPNFITKMENAINEKKEGFEQDLKDIFTEIKEGNVDLVSTSTS